MKTIFTFSKHTIRNLIIISVLTLLPFSQLVAQSKHIVEVTQNVFTPDELEIVAGDTVEWRNTDGYHNVNGTTDTYPSNPESFGNSAGNGWTYSHVFTIAGEYDYQCDPHVGLGMVGKISVKEDDGNGEKHMLTINFTGMNPHIGQNLRLAVIEKNSGMEISRLDTIAEEDFMVHVFGIENGMAYNVDFYADHNSNGMYDAPPTDHAWRLDLDNVMGDTTLNFAHNTDFTDIMWQNRLTVHFTGMNPHVGQDLWMAVTDKTSGMEVDRVKTTADVDFMVHVYGIENGMSYNVDFYADHNSNGMYDAPPTDHAWRLDLDDVMGDTTLNFAHNTDFTDIMWQNRLTVNFTGMNPHVGQDLWLAVTDKTSGMEVDRVKTTADVDFMVHVYGIENGMSYNVDFYADHNQNGKYDAPPADHAWRLELENVTGDTTLTFAHNTNFTDIFETTSISEIGMNRLKMYPNPATDIVSIEMNEQNLRDFTLSVYDITGKLSLVESIHSNNKIVFGVQHLNRGMYFVELKTNSQRKTIKLIKK
jgi:plastocyanin